MPRPRLRLLGLAAFIFLPVIQLSACSDSGGDNPGGGAGGDSGGTGGALPQGGASGGQPHLGSGGIPAFFVCDQDAPRQPFVCAGDAIVVAAGDSQVVRLAEPSEGGAGGIGGEGEEFIHERLPWRPRLNGNTTPIEDDDIIIAFDACTPVEVYVAPLQLVEIANSSRPCEDGGLERRRAAESGALPFPSSPNFDYFKQIRISRAAFECLSLSPDGAESACVR